MRTYAYIIMTNLWISTFTFGGGYIVIPMIEKYYVDQRSYLTKQEVLELAAVAQSVPGAIAVNLCVASAYRIKGIPAAICALFASILPAFFILSIVSYYYDIVSSNALIQAILKGMEAAVAAVMIDVVLGMIQSIQKERKFHMNVLIPISFLAITVFQIHVAIVLCASVLYSLLWCRWRKVL